MSPSNEVTLQTAAFMDSAPARALEEPSRNEIRAIAEKFLTCVFEEVGKAPRFLDGHDMHKIVGHLLPARFGRRDPLARHVPTVLRAWLAHLEDESMISHIFELHQSLEGTLGEFERAVETGEVHHHAPPTEPIVNRGEKVGRNDPCPCGSGKKFKKCCWNLGA